MQRERELQRLGVCNADSYSRDAAADAADGLVRAREPEEDDWRIGKQLSAVVEDEPQARIGHRDDHVYRAVLILPSKVVPERQRRLVAGEEIGLQVLGEIVDGDVGVCRQPLADARVQNWDCSESSRRPSESSARSAGVRPVPRLTQLRVHAHRGVANASTTHARSRTAISERQPHGQLNLAG